MLPQVQLPIAKETSVFIQSHTCLKFDSINVKEYISRLHKHIYIVKMCTLYLYVFEIKQFVRQVM